MPRISHCLARVRVWTPCLCVIALTCAGAWIRGEDLDASPIAADEAFSWRIARLPVSEILAKASADTPPPIHFLLEKAWIAAFGDSLRALRAMSAIAGALTIPLVYSLVAMSTRGIDRAPRVGALTSCALTAFHAFEVAHSRTARMYSLGILLTACSSWLLLRALLRPGRRPHARAAWGGYAVTMAAFCLCHHFAILTAFAHVVFVLGVCVRKAYGRGWLRFVVLARPFAAATALAVCIYSPWMPATLTQTMRVRADFWPSARGPAEIVDTVTHWALGWDIRWIGATWLLSAGLLVLIYAALAARSNGRLFWLMAIIPWFVTIAISTVGARPLMEERYLAFAHVGLLCLVGCVVNTIGWLPLRAAVALAVVALCLPGTKAYFRTMPHGPGGLGDVSRDLCRDYRRGDVVVPVHACTVHQLRFYLSRLGREDFVIKVPLQISRAGGQVSYVAALAADEILSAEMELQPGPCGRIWRIYVTGMPTGKAPKGWRVASTQRYAGRGDNVPIYRVARYDRMLASASGACHNKAEFRASVGLNAR